MKRVTLIVGIVIGIIGLLAILWYIIVITGVFSIFIPNPPRPEITYGEFPFRLTYEVAGELKVIEDTIICEFAGFESRGTAGKYRIWESHLKSGNERITLLSGKNDDSKFEISAFYGIPDYYMGDYTMQSKESYETVMADDRYLSYLQWKNGIQTGCSITKEEVWEKYKLKILNVQYSPPIQNTFK